MSVRPLALAAPTDRALSNCTNRSGQRHHSGLTTPLSCAAHGSGLPLPRHRAKLAADPHHLRSARGGCLPRLGTALGFVPGAGHSGREARQPHRWSNRGRGRNVPLPDVREVHRDQCRAVARTPELEAQDVALGVQESGLGCTVRRSRLPRHHRHRSEPQGSRDHHALRGRPDQGVRHHHRGPADRQPGATESYRT